MDQLPDLATPQPWWHYAIALVVVVAGFILARFARRGTLRLLSRTRGIPEALVDLAARFAGYLVILLGIGFGLALLGVNVQPLLAIVLIVAAIAVLVLRGVADNFAAGVLLQTSHPIAPGDEVTVETPDGTATGTVVELASRTVVVASYDGRTIHVPNAQLVKDAIIVTPVGAPRRSEVQVRVDRTGHDLDDLITRLTASASAAPGVTNDTPPRVLATEISPDRLIARVQFWHEGSQATTVVEAVVRQLSAALAAEGLSAAVTSVVTPPPITPPDSF